MSLAEKILGLIIQFGPGILELIQKAEEMYGPKTGPTKKATVRAWLLDKLNNDPRAAQIPIEKRESLVNSMIELAVTAAKATGELK